MKKPKKRRVRNTAYKGARNERRSMAYFGQFGYVCIRAAASHGVFDFVAFSPNSVHLVQCKTNRWPSYEEMKAMHAFPSPPGVVKEVHRWDDGQRQIRVQTFSLDGGWNWAESVLKNIDDETWQLR